MIAVLPPALADLSLDEKIEALQRQMTAQQQQLDELKAEQEQRDEQRKKTASNQTSEPVQPYQEERKISVTLGGQYRINFYNASNGQNTVNPGNNDQRAGRLRLHQDINFKFGNQFKTHLQLELQHTTGNVTSTKTNISVRHAVLDYTFHNGIRVKAGIVPLSDKFGDVLFSSDWNYNPLALEVTVPAGNGNLRVFAANLKEGAESIESDDFVHYEVDYFTSIGPHTEIAVSGIALNLENDLTRPGDGWHFNYGLSLKFAVHKDLAGRVAFIGSQTDSGLLGSSGNASGFFVIGEIKGALGKGEFGLLASHASGRQDGRGFLTPMAFAQTFGYWGYTGILTVQGPTDTGFDFDAVNVSNNGYGLTSFQAKYVIPLAPKFDGYVAAGWFGNSNVPDGRDRMIGVDLMVMGTYHFTKELGLDMGIAYSRLNDGVSGYFQGVQAMGLGPAFNQLQGTQRNKLVLFGRLQAEF